MGYDDAYCCEYGADLREQLAEANARCADLTARLDRERGARLADAASLDECARLLGCERGGVVEALIDVLDAYHKASEATASPLKHEVLHTDDREWCEPTPEPRLNEVIDGLKAGDAADLAKVSVNGVPMAEPVTWAVGDRVRRKYDNDVGTVTELPTGPDDDLDATMVIRWSNGYECKWCNTGRWDDLTRLPPDPVVTPCRFCHGAGTLRQKDGIDEDPITVPWS